MAFVAKMKMLARFWLRPGNTSSAHNVLAFLQKTLEVLANMTAGPLRADSGFYRIDVMDWLEQKSDNYCIPLKCIPH
jgi:hypothetical protein